MTHSLFFDVYQIDPPGDSITFLATLDNVFNRRYRPELNGMGSGEFSINRNDAQATAAILAKGNLVKVRIPSRQVAPVGSFLLDTGDFTLISSDEQGGEVLRFGGRGGLSYWDRAIWLSETYTLPWWPATMGTPPALTKGAVQVVAGTYRHYTVAGGVITGYANFTTTGFSAYFVGRRTYQWPSENNKRFLVHLTTTEDPSSPDYTGFYFHPHQSGVIETMASRAVGTGVISQVKLSDVGASPGAVLRYLYDEAVDASRPVAPIPLMTVDFDATLDSDGNAWSTTDALDGLNASVGEYYLGTIGQLLGTGVIDMVMGADFDMHAYNHYGRDLASATFAANKVRFERAVNIKDAIARTINDNVVATFAEVGGTDDVFARVELPDAATRIAREVSITGDSNDATVLEAIGLAELNLRLARGEAVSFPIAIGDDELTGRYTPGPPGSSGHFWIGDSVTLHTGAAEPDFDEIETRVTAITIDEDEAGGLQAVVSVRAGSLAATGGLGVSFPGSTSVVAEPPIAPSPFVPVYGITDTFNRADGAVGTSDAGLVWQNDFVPDDSVIVSGRFRMVRTGGTPTQTHHLDFTPPALPYRATLEFEFTGLAIDDVNFTAAGVAFVAHPNADTAEILGSPGDSAAFTWQAGIVYEFLATHDGTTARVKVWEQGDPEPGAWLLEATEPLADPGFLYLSYLSGGGTDDVIIDNLDISDIQGALANVPSAGQPVEIVIGISDGATVLSTAPSPYAPGSMRVYVDGLREFYIDETDPTTGEVTFETAPTAGEIVRFEYISA